MNVSSTYVPGLPGETKINVFKEKPVLNAVERAFTAIAKENPLDIQVGGNHYKQFVIQPIEYIIANKMNYCQGNVIKYVSRYPFKNGLEDLKKAKHYIDLLIQSEYGNDKV